ncbi:hypothetical protein ACE1SV_34330 [Streptomyces sennicomposti]
MGPVPVAVERVRGPLARSVVDRLTAALPSGSCLPVNGGSRGADPVYERAQDACRALAREAAKPRTVRCCGTGEPAAGHGGSGAG